MTSAAQKLAAAEIIAQAKTKMARVRLVLDGELLDRHATLTEQLDGSENGDRPRIAEEIVALEQQIADAEIEFVQRGMGRARWRKLLADHPPTDEQKAAGESYDDDFPYEALAASLIDPVMTADEIRQLDDCLDEMQFMALWGACLKANLGGGVTRPESQAARAIVESGRPRSKRRSASESVEAS